jgi:uncharacterized membrane protein
MPDIPPEDTALLLKGIRAVEAKHRSWRRWRGYGLLAGLSTVCTGVLLMFEVHRKASAAAAWSEEVLWLCPLSLLVYAAGIVMSVYVLGNWRADASAALLLSLASVATKGTPKGGSEMEKGK